MDKNKKVIMVDGNGSKWFEKAIFIVKNDRTVPNDILAEAEMIINNYFLKKYNNQMPCRVKNSYTPNVPIKKVKTAKKGFGLTDTVMFLSMLLCIILIIMVLNSVW